MKRRFVFLFDLGLIVCQLKGNSYVYKQTVMLSGHVLEDSGGHNVHAWILRNVKAVRTQSFVYCARVASLLFVLFGVCYVGQGDDYVSVQNG